MRRCVNCTHYNGTMCVLEDLAPCQFRATPEAERQRIRDGLFVILSCFVLALLAALILLLKKPEEAPAEQPAPEVSTIELLRMHHARQDTLTEWQMLTLAIMYTESRFQPDALGTAQDSGILQLRPVYVREVNRVAGTDYAPEDAFDPALALEIFEAMNAYHNPDRDLDTAIALHNRGEAYRARVLENLELIRRYEAARKLIKR